MGDNNKTAAEIKADQITRIIALAGLLNKSGFNEGYLKKISVAHRIDLLETLEAESQFVKDFCSGDVLILEKIKQDVV